MVDIQKITEGYHVEVPMKRYWKMVQACLWADFINKNGVAGQSRTRYQCLTCGEMKWNGNTNTPLICPLCTKTKTKEVKALWESGYFEIGED